MAEDGAPTTIAARIAALKLGEVGKAPGDAPPSYDQVVGRSGRKPPPPAPIRRPDVHNRQHSVNVPVLGAHTSAVSKDIGNQPAGLDRLPSAYGATDKANAPLARPVPALPPRRPTSRPAPQLPPRQPSQTPSLPPRRPSEYSLARRDSNESVASTASARSSVSGISNRTAASSRTNASGQAYTIKAPAYDPSTLPALLAKRTEEESPRVAVKASRSSSAVPTARSTSTPMVPSLPARPLADPIEDTPPARPPRRSALDQGFGQGSVAVRAEADRRAVGESPPSVPHDSRPDLTQLRSSKPKPQPQSIAPDSQYSNDGSCLKCRDFSAVDAHATQFPRDSIPSTDVGWIGNQVTAPFHSHTDKARALFTWLHHNIDYNTAALYSNNLKASTPASTIASGLAVCEGYAGLFAALATSAGLEAIVVGGHGKGVGYEAPAPGAALPPFAGNHAWNAVRIDGGVWKLIDTCWGAGHIEGWGQPYKRSFHPEQFTNDNDEFGRSHYPSDAKNFHRCDGRRSITWDEYLLGDGTGEPPRTFNGYIEEEGISKHSMQPVTKNISLRTELAKPYTRFTFQKTCPHWEPLRNGKGAWYCYIIQINGIDGRKPRNMPFECNGMSWWIDVPARELGAPGQKVKVAAVMSFDGKDGRGVTAKMFNEKNGRVGMGWGYVAEWEIIA